MPFLHLLCDEMLHDLGRWLRAAGFDTAIAEGESDRELIARATEEGRLLVTRDRHLAHIAPPGLPVVLLNNGGLDDCARLLRERLGLDWQNAPFTRCLLDNTPLRPATTAEAEAVPPRSRASAGPVRVCPRCGRIYWNGGHVRRMRARLAAWSGRA